MTSLRQRLRAANKRCSSFPEQSRNPDGSVTVKADAWLALLELRNMSTEIDNALWKLEELEQEIAASITEIHALREDLEAKDTEIAALTAAVEELEKRDEQFVSVKREGME